LFAFWVLSFAVMAGQNLDPELTVHLVTLLIQNEFSVDWLAPQSIKLICGMLGPLGLRQNVAEMLCNLAFAIHDHHGGVVPNREEVLEQLPGVDFWVIQLVLRLGFDQNPVSYYAVFFFIWWFMSNVGGVKGIIVDNNVMMWAHILDWVPINMTNQDEAQSIRESFYCRLFMDWFILLLVPLVKYSSQASPTWTFLRQFPTSVLQCMWTCLGFLILYERIRSIWFWTLEWISTMHNDN